MEHASTSLAGSSAAHGDHSPNRWDTEAAVTVAFRRGAVSGSAHPHRQQQHSWALKCSVLCSRFRSMLTRELAGDASDKTANSREGQQPNPAQHTPTLHLASDMATGPRLHGVCGLLPTTRVTQQQGVVDTVAQQPRPAASQRQETGQGRSTFDGSRGAPFAVPINVRRGRDASGKRCLGERPKVVPAAHAA